MITAPPKRYIFHLTSAVHFIMLICFLVQSLVQNQSSKGEFVMANVIGAVPLGDFFHTMSDSRGIIRLDLMPLWKDRIGRCTPAREQ